MKKLQNKKGFTLVEMIVVLAIIAILIALLAPNVAKLIKNAQTTSDSAKAKTIMNGAMTYGTEAVANGESVTVSSISHADGAFGVIITDSDDSDFTDVYYATAATVPVLIGGSGDAFLPSNTLKGSDRAYVYISAEGAVMGVVYYNGTTVKAVSGVCPSDVLAGTTYDFTTGDLRQKTIDPSDGTIS